MNDTVKLSRDNLTKTTDDGRIELIEEALTRVSGGIKTGAKFYEVKATHDGPWLAA